MKIDNKLMNKRERKGWEKCQPMMVNIKEKGYQFQFVKAEYSNLEKVLSRNLLIQKMIHGKHLII